MVKINDSKCVDETQIAAILKRIERIKSNATVQKNNEGENEHELSEVME